MLESSPQQISEMLDIGIIVALLAAVLWGSMMVPMKLAKNVDIIWFQLFLALGTLSATVIIVPLAGLFFETNLYGFISGLIWAIGNILALKSVDEVGMARATPVFTGTSIILSASWGIIYFREPITQLETALFGLTLLLLGTMIVSLIQGQHSKRWSKKTVISAVSSGLLLGSRFVPVQISGLSIEKALFPMALGITVTAVAIFLVGGSRHFNINNLSHGLSSGWIFAVGNYFGTLAILYLGLTVGYSITQISVLVAILWGVIYFKEMNRISNIIKIIIATILILIGAYILTISL